MSYEGTWFSGNSLTLRQKRIPRGMKKCPACKGSGYAYESASSSYELDDCGNCGGKGLVIKLDDDNEHEKEEEDVRQGEPAFA